MSECKPLPITNRNYDQLWDIFLAWQNRKQGRYAVSGGPLDDRWIMHIEVSADGTILYEVTDRDHAPIHEQHPWRDYRGDLQAEFKKWEIEARQRFGNLVGDFEQGL